MSWLTTRINISVIFSGALHLGLLALLLISPAHKRSTTETSAFVAVSLVRAGVPSTSEGDESPAPPRKTLLTGSGKEPPRNLVPEVTNEGNANDQTGAIAAQTAAPASSMQNAVITAPQAQISAYQRSLYELIAAKCHYPPSAKKRRLSGVTRLAFRIDRSGTVLDSWIQESSGSEVLDNAALAALAEASPLPHIPANMFSPLDFVIDIDLSLLQEKRELSPTASNDAAPVTRLMPVSGPQRA